MLCEGMIIVTSILLILNKQTQDEYVHVSRSYHYCFTNCTHHCNGDCTW